MRELWEFGIIESVLGVNEWVWGLINQLGDSINGILSSTNVIGGLINEVSDSIRVIS